MTNTVVMQCCTLYILQLYRCKFRRYERHNNYAGQHLSVDSSTRHSNILIALQSFVKNTFDLIGAFKKTFYMKICLYIFLQCSENTALLLSFFSNAILQYFPKHNKSWMKDALDEGRVHYRISSFMTEVTIIQKPIH